jgi:hypothetical protein
VKSRDRLTRRYGMVIGSNSGCYALEPSLR